METQLHQLCFFYQLPSSPTLTSLPLLKLTKSLPITSSSSTNSIVPCNCTGFHRTDGRFRFDPHNSDDEDDDDEFQFTSDEKKRVWWSDFDESDDVWEFDEDDEFWVFKVFRGFAWMLPAIAISLLLGTGPNAFIMALAVPLGQSALSLVFDTVSGRTSKSWKSAPKRKTKKKQYTSAAAAAANNNNNNNNNNNTRTDKRKREVNKTGGEKAGYSSWVSTDAVLRDKSGQRVPKYGGWDQLDDQAETQKRATRRKGNGRPKQRKEGKFNKIGRVRDTPLLLRLLIAVFPFLGSWTRFLF